jgi:hypothetical protein
MLKWRSPKRPLLLRHELSLLVRVHSTGRSLHLLHALHLQVLLALGRKLARLLARKLARLLDGKLARLLARKLAGLLARKLDGLLARLSGPHAHLTLHKQSANQSMRTACNASTTSKSDGRLKRGSGTKGKWES